MKIGGKTMKIGGKTMKKFIVMLYVFGIFGLVGCEPPSMNLQRSAARNAGDTGITMYLDGRKTNDVDEKKGRVVVIIKEIKDFIDKGEVGKLTVGALRKQINKIVPSEYQDLSNTILQYLSKFEVPTDKIPAKVIKNIRGALLGIKQGVVEYKLEDRKPDQPK